MRTTYEFSSCFSRRLAQLLLSFMVLASPLALAQMPAGPASETEISSAANNGASAAGSVTGAVEQTPDASMTAAEATLSKAPSDVEAATQVDALQPYLAALQTKNFSKKLEAAEALGAQQDERVLNILLALQANQLQFRETDQHTFIVKGNKITDALTGEPVADVNKSDLSRISLNNRLRNLLTGLIAAQQLLSPNEQRRYSAARDLLKKPSQENLAVLEQAIAQEDSKRVKDMMELAFNLIRIKSDNAVDRLAAIEGLSGSVYSEVRAALS